jgi:hypothetical protein
VPESRRLSPLLRTAPPTTEPLVANETQNTEGTVEVTLEINGTVKHLQIEPRRFDA